MPVHDLFKPGISNDALFRDPPNCKAGVLTLLGFRSVVITVNLLRSWLDSHGRAVARGRGVNPQMGGLTLKRET